VGSGISCWLERGVGLLMHEQVGSLRCMSLRSAQHDHKISSIPQPRTVSRMERRSGPWVAGSWNRPRSRAWASVPSVHSDWRSGRRQEGSHRRLVALLASAAPQVAVA